MSASVIGERATNSSVILSGLTVGRSKLLCLTYYGLLMSSMGNLPWPAFLTILNQTGLMLAVRICSVSASGSSLVGHPSCGGRREIPDCMSSYHILPSVSWSLLCSEDANQRLCAELKTSYARNCAYTTSIMLVQLSLFALYYRLFEASRSTRLAIYFGAAAVVVVYSALLADFLARCLPRPGQSMLRAFIARRCSRYEELRFYALTMFTVVSDAFLVAVPMRVVWGLRQLSTARKLALTGIFLHGLLCVKPVSLSSPFSPCSLLLHSL